MGVGTAAVAALDKRVPESLDARITVTTKDRVPLEDAPVHGHRPQGGCPVSSGSNPDGRTKATVAQLEEHLSRKENVGGSIPSSGSILKICGFMAFNEGDGETYSCGLEVHGPKVKHGEWRKV